MSEAFTCESCGRTFPKGWSDEEAAAEARQNFPGIDIGNPDEAGIVCDACYQHIMTRARAEAPGLIGPGWRGPVSDDPIGDALRADAEAARAEIRAAGVVCPSCRVNMADLPDGHMLAIRDIKGTGMAAECRDGTPATLAAVSTPMSDEEFHALQAAANISVWDEMRRRENEMFREVIGEGPPDFTGLLGMLKGEDQR